jgi:RimJ/RimL family protein N-acetyltransferase/ribosomal protein S18 acetylase RimI-like enzyme
VQPADRIRAFRHALEEAVSERVVPGPHAVGLFADSVANVYDLNYLRAAEPAPAVVLATEAQQAMETFLHRKVVVEREGRDAAQGFAELGWNVTPHLIMARQRESDRAVDTSMVREVDFDQLLDVRLEVTVAEPTGDTSLSQLLDRGKRRIMAAVPTRFFAAFDDGRIAAYCELRSDGVVAQIEDVNTLAEFRGRGLGRAVVQAAADEGSRTGELVFLEALADDWPKDLYAKLGFDVVDERVLFLLPPSPLTKLRVRTPRLELRLATVAELRELARVAQGGIHDPDRMPFAVPWTDAADQPGFENEFVEHHVSSLRGWRPDAWVLTLVAFADGRPVGVQSMRGERFAEERTVDTGSWLGRAWQGRGLGTEMRAGVLQLAFEGLGARRATSGAIQGNPQSLGVSHKLGYAETGSHLVSPRGEPLEHLDLELLSAAFASPVPVEVTGLDGLLALFGAEP